MLDETQNDTRNDAGYPPRLLAVARAQFLDIGFEDASIDAIAKAAHVSKQTVYAHFRDKAALFEATVRASLGEMQGLLAPLIQSTAPPAEVLLQAARWTFDHYVRPDNLGLYRANIDAATRFPVLAAEIHRTRIESSRALGEYMVAGLGAGGLTVSDPWRAALLFGNLVVGGMRILMGHEPPPPAVRERSYARIIDLVLNGRTTTAQQAAPAWRPEPEAAPPSPSAGMRLPPERLAALLDAAAASFLAHGLRRSRIDRVAAGVGVGVTTVYRQFGGKPGLFEAAVRHLLAGLEREAPPAATAPLDPARLEPGLIAAAEACLDRFLHPGHVGLLRLAITEAPRLPGLARLVYDRLWARVAGDLPQQFAEVPALGDAWQAADDFVILATHGHLYLTGTDLPDAAERRRLAEDAVGLFLKGLRRG